MEITEVKVFPIREEKLKAFVSIVFDSCFMVNDIKVIRGKDGLFISMPSRKKKSGEFKDVAHPLNNETRCWIEGRVLDEYERVLSERGESPEVGRRHLAVETAAPTPAAPLETAPPGAVVVEGGESGAAPPALIAEETAAGTAVEPGGKDPEANSLEEVEEMHLTDSFWSVT